MSAFLAAIVLAAAALLPPEAVLAKYVEALDTLATPSAIAFQYTVEQLGGADIEQAHRVYRSGNDERDETLVLDGERLATPQIRIFRGRSDRYAVARLAPRPNAYDFTYVGPRTVGARVSYVFRTAPKAPGAFAVNEVTIDGSKFLPSAVAFRTVANGVAGSGSVSYGPSGKYWVPLAAGASARVGPNVARERILFSGYDFPPALPPGTFGVSNLQ